MSSEKYGNYEIIDAHTHIFPEKIAESASINIGNFYDIPMVTGCGTSDILIDTECPLGISKMLVCSVATNPKQISSINNFIAEECRKHKEFIGFGATHPLSDDTAADLEQIKNLGLYGVKLHPDFQTFNADSPEAYKIYEMIEGQMPMLIHCGDSRYDYSDPLRIAKAAKDFPNMKIQASHLGGWSEWDIAEGCLAGLKNVKFDISSSMSFMPKENVIRMIRTYGVENCFFATDFPMWDAEKELDIFFSLGFTEEENRMILADNFKEFIGI